MDVYTVRKMHKRNEMAELLTYLIYIKTLCGVHASSAGVMLLQARH